MIIEARVKVLKDQNGFEPRFAVLPQTFLDDTVVILPLICTDNRVLRKTMGRRKGEDRRNP